ncbi:alpha/beta fold hydrolase [Salinicoccus sp. HZC-1]|uniref:alpha/beta fold hydrolase n=1 Tax=Salinicoccus sp. HZC-1 TaxID=3385497 RepID=UPI00398AFC78
MDRIIDVYRFNHHSIEYSVTGDGQNPVLFLHGGHSNCHEVFGVEALVNQGLTVIIPSRPGYGHTSKEIGDSLAKACEYYIELLNHLSIGKVHLITISAGGPSGIHLASKYPDRVRTLTLQSAVTKEWLTSENHLYKISHIIFRPPFEKMTWKLLSTFNTLFPKFTFRGMLSSFSTLPYKDILNRISDTDIEDIRKMNNRQSSGSGFLIDLLQSNQITSQYLQDIMSPTLIIHSKYDASVPTDHAFYAQRNIPNSSLISSESWGHIIWLGQHAEEMNAKTTDFLKKHRNTEME